MSPHTIPMPLVLWALAARRKGVQMNVSRAAMLRVAIALSYPQPKPFRSPS